MVRASFKERYNLLIIALFLLVPCAFGANRGLAQDAKDEVKRTSVIKEVMGEVTWLKKGRYIAVALSSGEAEMLLPIDSDIKVEHKKSLDEISAGDTVRVKYEEVTDQRPDGSTTLIGRKAKVISFIRAGARKPEVKKPEEGDVLKSE